ncbi:leucine--tRNA ligase [Christensenellaceae bacterium OttesenSCG-928-L17]|nr:leucine--tRNA ligase [Christensenellaceae bacterium OttesenSCG-928-L17]
MNRYNPKEIEQKWQTIWEEAKPFEAAPPSDQPKLYLAEMFPYPSGAGLHVGHVRNFSIVDALTRFYSQNGMNVLRPFGYDTFGLPAENYAIKTGTSPQTATEQNIAAFRNQLKKLGYYVDWSREISTSDPEYYRWTQWCFLQLFKKGLAYQAENYQWWCPIDQTVLANEQVENGHCWRCGSEVEKKKMKQWFFKITAYADELLDDIDALDWPEKIKTQQRNWIGRSIGAEIDFKTESGSIITVFTTRPDTIFGATFMVLAPEHPLVAKLTTEDTRQKVDQYREQTLKKSEIERQENKEKTGVFTGSYATNPATGEQIPIWVADYVLMGYGTGAIMAVPAHDERDLAFAEQFDLPVVKVVDDNGIMQNSGPLSGKNSNDIREETIAWLEREGIGRSKTTYRMRDWLISRQRYWGAPIPIAYDKDGNPHAIPEDQLPVVLPEVTDYQPDNSGRSALAKQKDWLKVTIDGEEMTRETDTMDGYACSSWYLWRYTDPHNDKQAWNPAKANFWNPIDFYVGGDHAVAHLLYVRFWTKFFADEGLLDFREPVKKLLYNGYINAPDGKKMSKSKGNVIDPLEIIDQGYGADTLRTYELFIGPYDQDAAWEPRAIGGVYRFLNRCWTLSQNVTAKTTDASIISRHKTIKKVTEDLHRNSFNTAVAALMEYTNDLYKTPHTKEDIITLAKLLKPFAPHLASEILETLDSDDTWPEWDEQYLSSDTVEFVVQVNGKLRAHVTLPASDATDVAKIEATALADPQIQKHLSGATPRRIITLPSRKLVNIVI